jgi:hypothetical protein
MNTMGRPKGEHRGTQDEGLAARRAAGRMESAP